MTELLSRSLGQYQIIEELGHGGMAVVYKAYQPALNRYVAVKVLLEHLGRDAEFVERFRREAHDAAMLQHPHIIHVYEVAAEAGFHYLVMDYIEGSSLSARLKRQGTLDVNTALGIVRQVGSALDYAHAKGIVHRDVKPSNVLLTNDGLAVLSDFGIAKAAAESRITQAGTVVGTPEYMSPEQTRGETLDGRSDLYSLGIVLYEMLTGQVPFRGEAPAAVLYKQVHEQPLAASHLRANIPTEVNRVILRALEKDKNQRCASGQELSAALEQAIGRIPTPPPWARQVGHSTPVPKHQTPPPMHRTPAPVRKTPAPTHTTPTPGPGTNRAVKPITSKPTTGPRIANPWLLVTALAGLVILAVWLATAMSR